MPTFTVESAPLVDVVCDLLVVGATSRDVDGQATAAVTDAATAVAAALDVDLPATLDAVGFTGEAGSVARVPTRARVPASTVLVVGLGASPDADAVRVAGAQVAAATSRLAVAASSLPWHVSGVDPTDAAAAFVEGVALGAYRFTALRSEPEPHALERIVLAAPDGGTDVGEAVATAADVADAVCVTRDLVNTPPAQKRPPDLAERVTRLFDGTGVGVAVLDDDQLRDGGYGGLVGVAAGSEVGARLVELTWAPDGAHEHVAIVGKGITFDSGGLSLKPSPAMEKMKYDMAGSAAVVGVVRAAAALDLPVAVTGIMALAENMPGGSATRPGDVLRMRDGSTVEVVNTDAEGRLVLADALVHACALGADVVIDVATLTGAAKVALGTRWAIVMSDDDDLVGSLRAAGERAAEPFWQLPLEDAYEEEMRSDVADVRNAGWKDAGTIRAGLFLRRFVSDDVRWAHLDIAGVAWTENQDGYRTAGGNGRPVRALVDWLRHR